MNVFTKYGIMSCSNASEQVLVNGDYIQFHC